MDLEGHPLSCPNIWAPTARTPSNGSGGKTLQLGQTGLMFKSLMSLLASFMNLAGPDLIIILLIILVLFGAKKLPELARGMGQAVKEFQKAKDEFGDELNKAAKTDPEATKQDIKPAQSTVPRIADQPASGATQPDPSQTITPGDKADQV
jgi:sec-independent protein translocase protein TatA